MQVFWFYNMSKIEEGSNVSKLVVWVVEVAQGPYHSMTGRITESGYWLRGYWCYESLLPWLRGEQHAVVLRWASCHLPSATQFRQWIRQHTVWGADARLCRQSPDAVLQMYVCNVNVRITTRVGLVSEWESYSSILKSPECIKTKLTFSYF